MTLPLPLLTIRVIIAQPFPVEGSNGRHQQGTLAA